MYCKFEVTDNVEQYYAIGIPNPHIMYCGLDPVYRTIYYRVPSIGAAQLCGGVERVPYWLVKSAGLVRMISLNPLNQCGPAIAAITPLPAQNKQKVGSVLLNKDGMFISMPALGQCQSKQKSR